MPSKYTNEFPSLTSKAKVPKHGAISSLNNVCFVPVEVWCDSWFAIESLFCLGRELNAIEGHVVLNDNGFILNRASFIRKLFWNKVFLHHKRTQPVKGNATQNMKEKQCLDECCKLQVPKLAFRTKNASKTLAMLFSNWIRYLFKANQL